MFFSKTYLLLNKEKEFKPHLVIYLLVYVNEVNSGFLKTKITENRIFWYFCIQSLQQGVVGQQEVIQFWKRVKVLQDREPLNILHPHPHVDQE